MTSKARVAGLLAAVVALTVLYAGLRWCRAVPADPFGTDGLVCFMGEVALADVLPPSGDAWLVVEAGDPLLAGRISFLGQVDYVPDLLKRSEIHVAPSIFDDPSPNVVMEAKQAARPSVVFPKGGLPELVEDGIDGFVCTEPTAANLTSALRAYLEDPKLVPRHGQAAKASLKRLGVDTFDERWVAVYQSASR